MRLRSVDREKALDLWAAGSTARDITDGLSLDGFVYEESDVRGAIRVARGEGDKRADLHRHGGESTPWTAELEIKLTALWKAGKSAIVIARSLGAGLTRNAVIGKAHRMGLDARVRPARKAPRQRRREAVPPGVKPTKGAKIAKIVMARDKAVKVHVNAGNIRAKKESRKLDRVEVLPVTPTAPESVPVTLLELGKNCCHWPVGDAEGSAQLYCGAPKAKAYCQFHEGRRGRASAGRQKAEPIRQTAAMQRNGSWS